MKNRNDNDRRKRTDRRKFANPNYDGPERRTTDRRSGKDRRE